LIISLEKDNFVNIEELEVNSEGLGDFGVLLECRPQLQEFLSNIDLHISVEVFVEVGVFLFDYIPDLLGNDLLELFGPSAYLYLVLCIYLQLIQLEQFLLGEGLLGSLEIVESFI
jgi:hypothetical protein